MWKRKKNSSQFQRQVAVLSSTLLKVMKNIEILQEIFICTEEFSIGILSANKYILYNLNIFVTFLIMWIFIVPPAGEDFNYFFSFGTKDPILWHSLMMQTALRYYNLPQQTVRNMIARNFTCRGS